MTAQAIEIQRVKKMTMGSVAKRSNDAHHQLASSGTAEDSKLG